MYNSTQLSCLYSSIFVTLCVCMTQYIRLHLTLFELCSPWPDSEHCVVPFPTNCSRGRNYLGERQTQEVWVFHGWRVIRPSVPQLCARRPDDRPVQTQQEGWLWHTSSMETEPRQRQCPTGGTPPLPGPWRRGQPDIDIAKWSSPTEKS